MSNRKNKKSINAIEEAPLDQSLDVSMNQNDPNDLDVSDDEVGGTRIGDIYIPPPVQPYCSTESKGPRVIITNIIIENFKSYAGKVELGPFHHVSINHKILNLE